MNQLFRKKRRLCFKDAMDFVYSGEFYPGEGEVGRNKIKEEDGKKEVPLQLEVRRSNEQTEIWEPAVPTNGRPGLIASGVRVSEISCAGKRPVAVRTGHPPPGGRRSSPMRAPCIPPRRLPSRGIPGTPISFRPDCSLPAEGSTRGALLRRRRRQEVFRIPQKRRNHPCGTARRDRVFPPP